MNKLSITLLTAGLAITALGGMAQKKVTVHGSVQADVVFPEVDDAIHTGTYDQKVLFNTYAGVNLASQYVDAGLRMEFMKWPLPGYEPDFSGWGLANIYVKGKYKNADLTVGDFYEQFGAGFILRTYEERSLGIDNSLRGARLNYKPIRGLHLTALGGVQRCYWDWKTSTKVYGANAEFYINEWVPAIERHNATWSVGASYVLKNEKEQEIFVPGTLAYLNLPELVNAVDVRSNFNKGPWNILGEFAWKGQDPGADNDYTYRPGTAAMLSGSYSKKGFSAMLQAKRSENFAFRSQRDRKGIAAFINNMPAFTYQHTYSLPALYPYASQYGPGEWAFQGQVVYNFKRKTPLGGKYGTKVTGNVSYISSLVHEGNPEHKFELPNGSVVSSIMGTDGYNSPFFKIGSMNYFDANVQIEKKVSGPLQLGFMYMYQRFNNQIVKIVETEEKWINSNILVGEAKYKFNKKFTLRGELQYLFTKQDQKDWAYGLLELSYNPYLMVSVSDMWNCGDTKTHYYMFGVTGNYRSNRLMLSYGRTRKGFNCSGGVCREVPAMHGFQINYSYNF